MTTLGRIDEFNPEAETITAYLERVELFFVANKVEDDRKASVLLTLVGGTVYGVLRNLLSPNKPQDKTFDELKKELKGHYAPEHSEIAERFRFHKRNQLSTESLSQYVAELKKLASSCNFGNYLDDALRDRFVCGIAHEGIQKRLLATHSDSSAPDTKLTFKKAFDIAQSVEVAEKDVHDFKRKEVVTLAKINSSFQRGQVRNPNKCSHCGRTNHISKECRLKDATCHNCDRRGHIATVCKAPKRHRGQDSKNKGTKWLHQITPKKVEEELHMFQLGTNSSNPIKLNVSVNGSLLPMELDTGAAVSVISLRTKNKYFPTVPLKESCVRLRTYTKEQISVVGEIQVSVCYENQAEELKLYVLEEDGPTLFGRDWLEYLHLNWKMIKFTTAEAVDGSVKSLLEKYRDVFSSELGLVKSFEAKLEVKPDTPPCFKRPRPVPFALKPKIDEELDRLLDAGIIEKVHHSDWASPIVPVPKKDGRIRICGDYKVSLNSSLVVDQHPLPNPEELFTVLTGGQQFSKLDLSRAYQQMVLEVDSRKYTTINTHRGLYSYTRLPFGIASAPAIFQRTMDAVLQNIPHVICYLDDILVTGRNRKDHLRNLEEVMSRLQYYGFRVQKDKCLFLTDSVHYLGHRIDAEGIHTSGDKLDAILNAPTPKNVQQLRAFLGLLNYYGKFLNNLSTVIHPLNRLLRTNVKWSWTNECRESFKEAKNLLKKSNVLIHYDPSLPVKLAGDASNYGVGAVLSHVTPDGQERPILFASRTLSTSERNYSQVEKEALSLIYGIKKFHRYLYGRSFTLVTDHKPLTTILGSKKNIPSLAAARLQRWAIILSAYNYNIEFRPTQEHSNADMLSRLPLKENEDECQLLESEATIFNISQIDLLPVTQSQLKIATSRDRTLSQVFRFTKYGWPEAMSGVDKELEPYWSRRNELTIQNGCLMWGIRVVIPPNYREKILQEIHISHSGMSRMKSLARCHVWWPLLDRQIENLCKSCRACQEVKPSPAIAPLHPWSWPTRPWQRVHIDFAGPFLGSMFFLLIDSHSKWPEIYPMSTTSVSKTLDILRQIFSSYGLPEQIVSDNGSQFTSEEFAEFTTKNGIKHIKTAPYHPSSNGAVERLVQSFKRSMRASEREGKSIQHSLYNFLLSYRITPHATTNISPSELFLKRSLRTRLDLLKPDVAVYVGKKQAQQKLDHDNSRVIRTFTIGQKVMAKNFRDGPKWVPGVISKILGPLSYLVQMEDGLMWRRHVDHIRDNSTSSSHIPDVDYDPIPNIPETVTSTTDNELNQSLDTDQVETSPNLSTPTNRYPQRVRRPPIRYE